MPIIELPRWRHLGGITVRAWARFKQLQKRHGFVTRFLLRPCLVSVILAASAEPFGTVREVLASWKTLTKPRESNEDHKRSA